jgi:hypothetical protein
MVEDADDVLRNDFLHDRHADEPNRGVRRSLRLLQSELAPRLLPGRRAAGDFLRLDAERLRSVKLNVTGYRLPSEEQVERWAVAVPDGFRFAVKPPGRELCSLADLRRAGAPARRPARAGGRVLETPRDEGLLALLLGSTDLPLALDLRLESWADTDVAPAMRVGDESPHGPFAYLRFRDPPYDEAALAGIAARPGPPGGGPERLRVLPARGRAHTPAYALRVLEQLRRPD